jgi:hypothetical protein
VVWLGVSGPIGNVYGTPETELTIMQTEPGTASGIPLAVGPPGVITVMVPVSGGPATPGETTTEHPIVTGGPGIDLHSYAGEKSVFPANLIIAPLTVVDALPSSVAPDFPLSETLVPPTLTSPLASRVKFP